MGDETFIVGYYGGIYIEGSNKTPCHKCKKKVYISPSSQEIIKERNAKVICMKCMTKLPPEDVKIEITDSQIRELIKHIEEREIYEGE